MKKPLAVTGVLLAIVVGLVTYNNSSKTSVLQTKTSTPDAESAEYADVQFKPVFTFATNVNK